ncbi:hypothetical protein B5F40_03155 [Gordonibacter sp. An230]|uniref:hypothetical protein n=1 Tax=Gordonibacter sp. An230 TaxID=1965592 RepID=UPI000B36867D|nr:hypothetical protein [Gordonibacter sp. An230]OUO91450.1 hypothetical protein B5F40_03155 [Gordonibacter sp. An230]
MIGAEEESVTKDASEVVEACDGCEQESVGVRFEARKRPAFLTCAWWTKRRAAIAIVCAAVLVAAVGAGVWLASSQPQETGGSGPSSTSQEADAVLARVEATVKAEGAGPESTKAVAEVLGKDGLAVIGAVEVAPNEAAPIGELPEGPYSLRVVQAPVNGDGSTYRLPEQPTAFEVGPDGRSVAVSEDLEPLAVEDMTKEQLEAAADELEEAGKEGAQSVREEAVGRPSVPGSAGEVTSEPSAPSVENPSNPNGGGTSTAPSDPPSKPDEGPSTPSHAHSWVAQTETVHHEAEYKTVHHDAVYDTIHHDAVKEGRIVCNGCGSMFPDAASYTQHSKDAIINNTICATAGAHNTSVVVQEAWDETVLVSEAWDEQVLVKDAWDETVVTGYKCSGCGATK